MAAVHNLVSLDDWLAFQEQQHSKTIDLGLERVRQMAQRLGLLSPTALTITVAGTNGKGSSTAALSAIYTTAGYRTGWYASPHLLNYNERICIDNQPVSDALLVQAIEAIYAQLEGLTLSYFEWGTLAALWLFKQQSCQVQVLEVGLGGRLDAVNVINADAALITPIDLDHQAWLGNDRASIAKEKAGILRGHQVAVCSDPNPEKSLLDYASNLGVTLALMSKDYHYQRLDAQTWQWQGLNKRLRLPQPKLLGEFQLANLSGVLMLVQALQSKLPVTDEQIAQGLQAIQLVGRLDYRQLADASWLFDVAHNPQSIRALADYCATHLKNQSIAMVFSALSDKEIAPMVAQLAPYVERWFVAVLSSPRAASRAQLQQALAILPDEQLVWCDSIEQACERAQQQPTAVLRLVTGSFVTVEQGLRWWQQQKMNLGEA
ncbi:MAG: bifunctional folylpolyglutamate synthase/dihydrofolate synthase [Gammaproteobacteria bacterium]|nr:bifunctional folylpolyglutamate synthase/dihydrofolate synthase [Gammaproteobacteria bacterium]